MVETNTAPEYVHKLNCTLLKKREGHKQEIIKTSKIYRNQKVVVMKKSTGLQCKLTT